MIAAAAPLRGHPPDLHQQCHGHELQLPYLSVRFCGVALRGWPAAFLFVPTTVIATLSQQSEILTRNRYEKHPIAIRNPLKNYGEPANLPLHLRGLMYGFAGTRTSTRTRVKNQPY
jgi:hypothetical protein